MEVEKKIDSEIFTRIRELVYQKSGIKLDVNKESLIRARVGKRVRILGLLSHEEYLKHVIESNDEKEIIHLLDAISTNVTSFFRDADHFDLLRILLKEWTASGQKKFRIWSAACSSGEEPYTIAMTVLDAIGGNADVRILATDISTRILEKAQLCMYESEKVSQIPADLKEKYFEKPNSNNNGLYKAKPIMRNMIVFKRLNLSETPFPMQGPMDVVFCRNVMIYFDHNTRQRLLNEILRLLKPNGYLFVGHAESLIGLANGFRTIRPSIYLKEA
jgi:chemotaxis protein methyltransferase CheR